MKMNKLSKMVLTVLAAIFMISSSGINVVSATVNNPPNHYVIHNQLLVVHQQIAGSWGSWQTSFGTVHSGEGTRMNVFYRNDTNANATVRIERLVDGTWFLVLSMSVRANSSNTVQHPNVALNSEHRVTVQGANGAAVAGEIGIRQTNQALQ